MGAFTDPFQVKAGFEGIVCLHNWVRVKDGNQYDLFAGRVRVLSSAEVVGFEALTDRSANWVAIVQGEHEQTTFPGCQVRAVTACSLAGLEKPVYLVP